MFGAVCAAARPVDRTASRDPSLGATLLPKPGRIDRAFALGVPLPFASENVPLITPHFFWLRVGFSVVVWQRSMAFA